MVRGVVKIVSLTVVTLLVLGSSYTAVHVLPPLIESVVVAQKTIPFQTESKDRNMLVIGDSTAYGIGAYHPADSTAGRVSTALDLGVENRARSGARTREMVLQLNRAREKYYDLILIQVGANDVMKFSSIEKTANELDAALSRAHELSDRVVLLTATDIGSAPIWPRLLGDVYSRRTKELRDEFIEVSERYGAEYVDIFSDIDLFEVNFDLYYTPDTAHPSSDGYALWAMDILESIQSRWPEFYERS